MFFILKGIVKVYSNKIDEKWNNNFIDLKDTTQ